MTAYLLEGVAAAVGCANALFHIALADRPVYLMEPGALAAGRPRLPLGIVPAVALFAIADVAFVAGIARPLAMLVVIGTLFAIRLVEIRTYSGDTVVRLGKYAPAAATMLAWVIAFAVATALGRSPERAEALGWDAASGMYGAAFGLAALAKVRETGWSWISGANMQLLVAERAHDAGPVGRLRGWVARSPRLCAGMGVVGLLAEAVGPLLVVRDLRPALSGFIVSFYGLIWLLLGYAEPEWVLVALALGVAAA
jgi:hypothetical protein